MHLLAAEISTDWWFSLFQVILIDLTLAADNAVVIGLAAAGLPAELRNRAILIGIGAATVLRIFFALITTQLLALTGLVFAGGILLLWVCWKMWRELRSGHAHDQATAEEALTNSDINADGKVAGGVGTKTLRQASIQIVIADVSMSLDNVLAVAGAARHHTEVLIVGLLLSIGLMGFASTWIARIIGRYHWIAYIGLAIIFYVAGKMIFEGYHQIATGMH